MYSVKDTANDPPDGKTWNPVRVADHFGGFFLMQVHSTNPFGDTKQNVPFCSFRAVHCTAMIHLHIHSCM